jgi:hypothetical protein
MQSQTFDNIEKLLANDSPLNLAFCCQSPNTRTGYFRIGAAMRQL